MISWTDVLAQLERYQDLRREAETYRLIRLAQAGRERRNRFYCQALSWLGKQLVAWGRRLQERYDTAAATLALRPADRAN